jgi:UDP-N-acetylglucosamine 2-epimerase
MTAQVMIVFGTRPEAIKMMPVVRAMRTRSELVPLTVSTGQHREMLNQVLETFGETADVDLAIMSAGQTLEGLTRLVLEQVSDLIQRRRPALLLVHGDTTTAMASALAAFYAGVPVGHVEAGLRSHDIYRPWPEEFNRLSIDSVADLLFAPTEDAANNLKRESLRQREIHITGNTGIDALLQVSQRVGSGIPAHLGLPALAPGTDLVLVTGHRRESFGDGFRNICEGIRRIVQRPRVRVIYPVHLNPNVRDIVHAELAGLDAVHLTDPVSYSDMVALMGAAKVILTDSGGIQEEGPSLGKPVVVMREVTERPEGVAAGVVSLVGTDPQKIADEVLSLLSDKDLYSRRARRVFLYGDGSAGDKIAAAVSQFCAGRQSSVEAT